MQETNASKDDVLPLAHFTLAFENSQVVCNTPIPLQKIAAVSSACRSVRDISLACSLLQSLFSRFQVLPRDVGR